MANVFRQSFIRKITDMVESYEGIVGAHDLIVHNYGPNRSMATIHAEVPNDVSIEASHEIIDRIERDAKKELNILLVIHMDPVEMRDEEVLELRDKTSHIVHALDPELHFHDFRVLKENEQKNLIFDLVVPDSYTEKDANRVMLPAYSTPSRNGKRTWIVSLRWTEALKLRKII